MKALNKHLGIVAPMFRPNIDTDMIIPKQFLKSIKRTGFGPNLFDEMRYLDEGQPGQDNSKRPLNPDFILNKAEYKNASVLLAGENFGCGSSREHAPWALEDFGIRVIIAPSYADIFYNNSFKNGLLPIVLDQKIVEELVADCETYDHFKIAVNLEEQTIKSSSGKEFKFEIDEFKKHCLINGLDEIGLTLQKSDAIKAFEEKHKGSQPWLFA